MRALRMFRAAALLAILPLLRACGGDVDADHVPIATGGSSGSALLDSSSGGSTGLDSAPEEDVVGPVVDASAVDAGNVGDAGDAGDVGEDSGSSCSPGCKGSCPPGELAGVALASCCTALGECGLLVDSQT